MGARLQRGLNDLATTHPQLAKEWDFGLNAPLKPTEVSAGSDKKIYWKCSSGHTFMSSLYERSSKGASCPYCSGKAVLAGFNDLETVRPDLAKEWDYELNAPLTPKDVTRGSNKKVYWVCEVNHRFLASINNRSRGSTCPYCAGKAVLAGFNDLATTHPEIAAEWDYERNAPLTPKDVSVGAKAKAYWTCSVGHSFFSVIHTRRKSGCPYCSGKAVLVGFNDLATTHPEIAAEWDYERNAPLTPKDVSRGSGKNVFWLCPSGHRQQKSVSNRLRLGCAYCAGKAVLAGFNDLETVRPDLAKEWDYERNAPATPQEVTAGSARKFFWLCSDGHSYQKSVKGRSKESGCPYCSGKAVLAGFNDLETVRPDLAKEWDYERNAPVTPKDITPGSDRKYFWVCVVGHSQRMTPRSRRDGGCAYCSGKAVLAGFNDLETVRPDLAKEWDYERNAPLTPKDVTAGANKKAHWLCPDGHSYLATINDRNRKSSCPYCSGKAVLVGFNDLETVRPDLAKEWDYERNAPLTPKDVSRGSGTKVFWLCEAGHSYRASVGDKSHGTGCPTCARYGYDSTREGLFYFITNPTLRARKVGITNPGRSKDRLERFGKEWLTVKTIRHDDGLVVRDLESAILRWIRKDVGLPQYLGKEEMGKYGGQSETFSIDGPTDEEVAQKIDELFKQILGDR